MEKKSKPNPTAFKSGKWKSWVLPILSQISFSISWQHRLKAASFPFSVPEAMLWLWKWWTIPLKRAKFYFGPNVWFCLQWNFAYLTLRKMFNDRFGYFPYQIKPTEFYQFLELTWRIVLLPGREQPKKTQPKTQQIKPNKKEESQNHSRQISY